jgi:hypothetical protein
LLERKEMMVGSSQQLLLQRKGKAVADKSAPSLASAEMVVVAVKAATREISKAAIVWALTHVVQPGGSIILLVVVPAHSSGSVLFLAFLPAKCTYLLWYCSVLCFSLRSISCLFPNLSFMLPRMPKLSVSMLPFVD